jgi:hypothetical protein
MTLITLVFLQLGLASFFFSGLNFAPVEKFQL